MSSTVLSLNKSSMSGKSSHEWGTREPGEMCSMRKLCWCSRAETYTCPQDRKTRERSACCSTRHGLLLWLTRGIHPGAYIVPVIDRLEFPPVAQWAGPAFSPLFHFERLKQFPSCREKFSMTEDTPKVTDHFSCHILQYLFTRKIHF